MRNIRGVMAGLVVACVAQAATEPVVGRWLWVEKQTLSFRADGTVEMTKGGQRVKSGRWTTKDAAARQYSVQWAEGGPAKILEVSSDGWSLSGVTADGVPEHGERLDDGAPTP